VSARQDVTSADLHGIWAVAVRGDADLTTVEEVQAHFDAAFDRGRRAVIIDLAQADFIDSSFMHMLWRSVRRIRAARGELAIVCGEGNVRRALDVFGVASTVAIYSSGDEAAAALAKLPDAATPGDST
jgi:anti-sigma B factor antagonist